MPKAKSSHLAFAKLEGAGNDFILINRARAGNVPDPGALALALCERRRSVGADGLIIVEPSERRDAHIRIRFFNPDGREAENSGNGTRCAARFALLEGLAPAEMLIETLAGDISARVNDDTVVLRYAAEPRLTLDATLTAPDGARRGHRVEIGNPHFVLPVKELPEGPIEPLCRPLRYARELGDAGANVHLAQVVNRHRVRIRSYERGVEAETLACGSGSMSAAAALCAAGLVDPPVSVLTWSGDTLTVRFQRRADGGITSLELEGPARLVFRGELSDPELRPYR